MNNNWTTVNIRKDLIEALQAAAIKNSTKYVKLKSATILEQILRKELSGYLTKE